MSITVLLADDHAVVRNGLQLLLDAHEDIEVVGGVGSGREAVRQVAELQPDVVIVDIAMPDLNGVAAAAQIRQICPHAQVIILSMHSTTEHVFRSLQAGARGYVLKESAGIEVVNAVRAVHTGRHYLSQKILERLIEDYVRRREAVEAETPLQRLSAREREVLQLVVEGKSSSEIAEILHLSPKTIETYRSRMMRKLGISDLPQLVKFAIQHRLIPLE